MDKLTEALKSLIPEEQLTDVSKAVKEMMAESNEKLEEEYNGKLKEAYELMETEKTQLEQTREEGYQQAYAIIDDLNKRIEIQREEFENHMDEQFEEAWKMIGEAKSEKETIEVDLYKEFDNKLQDMKDFMVDKVDQFLQLQNTEIYESAKREVLNDPRTLEHRVALDKITDIVSDRISDEDYSHVTSSKLQEAQQATSDLKAHLRVMESKNTRLTMQNNKLNESVKEQKNLLTESTKAKRKDSAASAKKASGRGHRVTDSGLIAEFNTPETNKPKEEVEVITEEEQSLKDLLFLSGVTQEK